MIYLHYRQRGIWPHRVSGFDAQSEADKIAPFEPVRNVDADYPPTLMIHGTADTDVPHDQSVQMVSQFKQQNIPHKLISISDHEALHVAFLVDVQNYHSLRRKRLDLGGRESDYQTSFSPSEMSYYAHENYLDAPPNYGNETRHDAALVAAAESGGANEPPLH